MLSISEIINAFSRGLIYQIKITRNNYLVKVKNTIQNMLERVICDTDLEKANIEDRWENLNMIDASKESSI